MGKQLEPGLRGHYDSELVLTDEFADPCSYCERDEAVLIAGRLTHNQPATHELCLLVRQIEVEQVLSSEDTG